MKPSTFEEFLQAIQPACDYSVRMARYATGLPDWRCKQYLNKAVELGLYTKKWVKGPGNNKNVPKAQRLIGRFHYTKL